MPDVKTAPIPLQIVPHAALVDWLTSKSVDKMIASMSTSARAKKAGRVLDRIRKTGGKYVSGLRVINWEKNLKFVYGVSFSDGALDDAVLSTGPAAAGLVADETCLFQTDVYMRTRGEYTELDAVVVAGVTESARADLEIHGITERIALSGARLFSTGLDEAGIEPDDTHEFHVPIKDQVISCVNLPVERIEHEEKHIGQLLLVTGVVETADPERIAGLAEAMTKNGHPGAEAFATLVTQSARKYPVED